MWCGFFEIKKAGKIFQEVALEMWEKRILYLLEKPTKFCCNHCDLFSKQKDIYPKFVQKNLF